MNAMFDRANLSPSDGDPGRLPEIWLLDADLVSSGGDPERIARDRLDRSERQRLRAFRHPGARLRFLAARLLARAALGERLGLPGPALVFGTAKGGKPFLADPPVPGLDFNLSHSGALVACAISTQGPVGVDVEVWDRPLPAADLARQWFTPAEAAWVARDPDRARLRFLALWTLKEACLKLTGQGLAGGLDRISFTPDRAGALLPSDPSLPACRLLLPRPGYWLAVCGPGLDVRPPHLHWPDVRHLLTTVRKNRD